MKYWPGAIRNAGVSAVAFLVVYEINYDTDKIHETRNQRVVFLSEGI